MSRIIELSQTVVTNPSLLQKAVDSLNNLKQYQPINAKFVQDQNGKITSGTFHYATAESIYSRGHVVLRYHGKGTPCYTPKDVLQNGHFTLMGDEDFKENGILAALIGDHYNAQVTKATMEQNGLSVEMIYGEDGSINIDGYAIEDIVTSEY